jgi:uncharacterized protein YjiS (DUF1127 family)
MDGSICHASSAIPAVSFQPQRRRISQILSQAVERALLWHDRARSRRMLLGLDDRMLRDIGVNRATAEVEGSQPFWRP